ncbi:MAG: hypothetical protein K9M54_00360 [Kiritimatiellales bacterium]|nr:hypothetical protein [Kiritimatiellales bacterium]
MHRMVLAGLLFCGTAWTDDSKDWKALREKNLKLGLDTERVDQTLGQCRKNGITAQEAEALLGPVCAAKAEALPTECIFVKIEEGLAKQVDAPRVAVAAEARLDCLRRAGRMVSNVRCGRGGDQQHLVMHTCMALESGLPDAVLQELFNRPAGFRYGRLIHVVEAGETLQLAGLEPQQTLHIMNDCLDRDLDRAELMRAVDFIIAEHANGRDFQSIHDDLWIHSD